MNDANSEPQAPSVQSVKETLSGENPNAEMDESINVCVRGAKEISSAHEIRKQNGSSECPRAARS